MNCATYYLNGHSIVEVALTRKGVTFRKRDNAFLSCSEPATLQSVAGGLSRALIRERLDHWTFLLGPKFSKHERAALHLSRWAHPKVVKVAIFFTLFHKRLCGPLANSLFHHRPNPSIPFNSSLQRVYAKADAHVQKIIDLLEAA